MRVLVSRFWELDSSMQLKIKSKYKIPMSIAKTFKDFQLTGGQTELLNRLDEFLVSKDFCFLLKGYAGTGKTFMMKGLTDYLKEANRPFVVAAPTGRAAKVISQRIKASAYTIHKTIYSNKDIKEFKTDNADGTETFKFYYELKNNSETANTLYIIDEASMLSDMYSEGEFFRFGSGFLLKDLLRYINFDNNDHRKKIIFIGDNAQLPPVNMNLSPALSVDYLQQNYQISAKSYELTEVVRQQKDSGILYNATKIRKYLKDNVFNQIDIETSFQDTKGIQHQDLLDTYLDACGNKIDDDTIIIAYSNASVKEYNDFVRGYFFPNHPSIVPKDRVVLVSNNYNYEIELLNGDFGVVQQVSSICETRNVTLKRKNKAGVLIEIKVPLTFRDIVIQFRDTHEQSFDISCKIIENLLYSKERDLSSDELKALYIDFKTRNPNLKAGTKELKDALRSDRYFNALRTKFGYAVTCHKAQGGEWKRVFLNCKTAMGYFNASYFRWLYTALTRAKEGLYTLDEPHFKIGSNLKPPNIENLAPRHDVLVLKPEVLETELSFGLSDEQPFLKNIFYSVFDLVKDLGLNIDSIKHLQFCEQYSFSKENNKAQINIYFTAQDKVGSLVKSGQNSELTNQVFEILQPLKGKSIIIEILTEQNLIDEPEIIFSEDKPFLKEFHAFVKGKVSEHGITINSITSRDYLEKYEFKKNGHTAIIDFHYTGKNQFKKFTPQPSHSTSTELLKTICQIIGELK